MSTTIISILLGIGGMFGWGIYDFLGGLFSRRIGSFNSLFWSQAAGALAILLFALVAGANFTLFVPVLLLTPAAAVVYSLGYLFLFTGFKKGNVSIVAATMNLWAVFTMTFAFLFMGQRLSTSQGVGVFMIISGAMLASVDWRGLGRQGAKLSLGVREAILGAFFFGIFWNISELISEQIGWLLTTLLVKFEIVLFLLLVAAVRRQPIRLEKSATSLKYLIFMMGVIEVSAVALVNYGLTIGDAILITPIASALSIVTIALAVIFLKDRVSRFQGVGIAAAIAGIILTAF